MKRNLLILLASAGISVAGLTEASAQNENPTLSPDTLRGIALWGNKSHQNNQDSGSNKENETFLSGAEGINSKNLTLPAQENSPASNRNPEEGTHTGGSPSANRGQDIPAAATGMEPGWNPGTPESGPQTPTTNASIPAQQASTKNESEVSYVPRVDGAVKAKLEVSLNDGEYRFNVRNTRFGVSGNVSRNMFYRIQVDFNNEGKLSILDSYAGYRTGGLDIRLGQQQYHFSTDLDRGPTASLFANRSFIAKYLTSYYGSELSGDKISHYVKTLGSRDLGIMGTYTFTKQVPLKLFLGLFNGSGINNPSWNNKINIIGRVEFGRAEGFRAAASYYNGSAPRHAFVVERDGVSSQEELNQKMNMVGAELHYVTGGFFIEGEYARRYLKTKVDNDDILNTTMTAALIHSYYRFEMPRRFVMSYIAPMVRWDLGNNMDYLNTANTVRETVDANRITVGINFGFGKKLVNSEIRLNYEKYFLKERPGDFSKNKLLQDKFTLEVVAAF